MFWTQSLFNFHLERRVVQHGPLKLLQISFENKLYKMPFFGVVELTFGMIFFRKAQILPFPSLRQGREACLP